MENLENIYSNCSDNSLTGSDYYLLALKNDLKTSVMGLFSRWIKFHDQSKLEEVRKIDRIIPDKTMRDLSFLEKNPLIVNEKNELTAFLKFGGYALVEKNLIDIHLNEIAVPLVCSSSVDKGFIQYDSLPQKNKNRLARDKFRAEIINRDNYQCRVCGGSPDDSVHVRLEVHHIKPWEEGGLTFKENLITLCGSCHSGASNFDRWRLYEKIGIQRHYQNNTFFAPQSNYSSEQYKKAIYIASNMVELLIKYNAR